MRIWRSAVYDVRFHQCEAIGSSICRVVPWPGGLATLRVPHNIARGEGRVLGVTGYLTAVLYNGLGRYEEAFAAARQACEHVDLGFHGWCLFELIKAATRTGDNEPRYRPWIGSKNAPGQRN